MSGSMRLSGQLGVEMTSQRTGRQTRKEKKTIVEDVKIQQCETPALLHQAQRFMCSCSAVNSRSHRHLEPQQNVSLLAKYFPCDHSDVTPRRDIPATTYYYYYGELTMHDA
ncbi:predicted protein [Histoplasma capsulatum var. duboisii H88]|uniref:Predicted protein n=1 Tax=Ajellomyces capsulatus (strain H88) TaxID=544711 RepID=F0UKR0_AJEC8|nr:predicted protein [Histoplasma capsulatum var. duboisii H88]